MATGEIVGIMDNNNNAKVNITIYGLHKSIKYDAIIDTGYTGGLVIPLVTAVDIGLTKAGAATITLASGESSVLPTFLASVMIGGNKHDAVCLVMGNEVLIGMELLSNYKLCIDAGSSIVSFEKEDHTGSYIQLVNNLKFLAGVK